MKSSFASSRVSDAGNNGRPCLDDDRDVLLHALSLSPGITQKHRPNHLKHDMTLSLQLLLQGATQALLAGAVISIGTTREIKV